MTQTGKKTLSLYSMKNQRAHLAYKRFSWLGPSWMVGVLVVFFAVTVLAHEVTVFNFSGGTVTARNSVL